MELIEKEVLLVKLLDEVSDQFKSEAESKKVKLTRGHTVNENISVQSDESVLRGILFSLIDTALKNAPAQCEVRIDIEQPDSNIIKISIGTLNSESKCHAKKLIENDESSTSLMLTEHMVKISGARLDLHVTTGNGYKYELEWPISLETHDSPKRQNTAHLNPDEVNSSKRNLSHHSRNTILLVEDQEEMLDYTAELLGDYYQVITAENGHEAWQIMKNTSSVFDLVICDIMMPEMDGFELLEKIRKDKVLATTPVALLTARKGDENIIKALAVGVSDYITKPFTKEILLAHCKHLLSNSKNRHRPILEDTNVTETEDFKRENTIKIADLNWLNSVEKIFRKHMSNRYFNMVMLAGELAISERQMRRKLKRITGMSPVQYMNEIKLNNARQMMISGKYNTVAEISYEVGFDTPKYFSALFRERYGVNPTEIMR
ncbi:MAG: response regulator [Reichenbachiella sp.]|uniref:response regulator n=1 Tax=Reichenbachiella sp. TaxID=2184521 RepID=UPI0032672D9D